MTFIIKYHIFSVYFLPKISWKFFKIICVWVEREFKAKTKTKSYSSVQFNIFDSNGYWLLSIIFWYSSFSSFCSFFVLFEMFDDEIQFYFQYYQRCFQKIQNFITIVAFMFIQIINKSQFWYFNVLNIIKNHVLNVVLHKKCIMHNAI